MATGRKYYSIERRAHRDGYIMPDVDKCHLPDPIRLDMQNKHPAELLTSIDIDAVFKRWKKSTRGEGEGGKKGEEDVRISEDAGRYLCDFIYFLSLAERRRRGEEGQVLFLHVPVEADAEAVERGVRIALELIRAVVVVGLKLQEGEE